MAAMKILFYKVSDDDEICCHWMMETKMMMIFIDGFSVGDGVGDGDGDSCCWVVVYNFPREAIFSLSHP